MQIGKITFTDREVDIISCILNSRGAKKIANILLISPRTVETHIQNILIKIGVNSQEAIIDFVEQSGQFKVIKEHYLNLLITAIFERQLKQISYLTKKLKISCSIVCNEQELKEDTLHLLTKHFKISGIEVIIKKSNSSSEPLQNNENYHNIYFLSKENIDQLFVAGSYELKKEDMVVVKDSETQILISKRNIALQIDNKIIDLSNKEQYFQNVFHIIKELAVGIDLSTFTSEFKRLRNSIIDSKGENINELLINHQKNKEAEQDKRINGSTSIVYKTRTTIFFVLILISLALLILLINIFVFKLPVKKVTPIVNDSSVINSLTKSELDNFFSLIKNNNFSANNITSEQIHKNHSLIGQIEKWLGSTTDKEKVLSHFDKKDILSEELVDYLSNLHALANYYIYHDHDGKKARTVLEHAKNLIENYVISRSKVKFTFALLSHENIYTELSIIKDLPEIYTQILYALGRSFFYQGNINDGMPYFELSRYLGNRLCLFEGYLSIRSGLGVIAQQEIERELKKKDYINAEKKILKTIALYKTLQQDNSSYILNYKPGSINTQTTIPAKDIYNILECRERIARNYAKLVLITSNAHYRGKYLEETITQIAGDNGLIGMLSQLGTLPNKKIASIYNSLGNILLEFHENSIDFSYLLNLTIKDLKLEAKDDLEAIEQIFKVAANYSRNTDYTKADSYDGLIKVHQKQINLNKLTAQDQKILQNEIAVLKSKRDNINKQLNRESKIYN